MVRSRRPSSVVRVEKIYMSLMSEPYHGERRPSIGSEARCALAGVNAREGHR